MWGLCRYGIYFLSLLRFPPSIQNYCFPLLRTFSFFWEKHNWIPLYCCLSELSSFWGSFSTWDKYKLCTGTRRRKVLSFLDVPKEFINYPKRNQGMFCFASSECHPGRISWSASEEMSVHKWQCKQTSAFTSHVEEFMAGALYSFQSSKK